MDFVFDPGSPRAQRARYGHFLSKKPVSLAAVFIAVASVSGGLYLLVSGSQAGWAALTPAAMVLTIYIWFKGQLENVPPGPFQGESVVMLHEALEQDMAASLHGKNDMSAYNLWKTLEGKEEQFFLHNRYGIDASFFEQFASRDPGSAQAVWHKAFQLHHTYQTPSYSNMLILVALITSVPGVEQILRSAGFALEDIMTSIGWMQDIKEKRRLVAAKKNFGGIGRDWAYGYTPVLRNLGHNVSESVERHGFFSDTSMHEQIVLQMTQIMSSSRSTITLVGEEGVGKTTCVYALAETLLADSTLPKNIRYSQIVEMDAASLLANAKRPGDLEALIIRILNEAHRAKNIILFFDEAQAFFGTGTGSVDLSQVLQPVLESGGVRMIFAMNPQQWQRLSGSGIAAKLTPVTVAPADETNTLAVLRDQIAVIEYKHDVVFTYQALREAYKLGLRYVNTQAMPGAALSLLQQTASTAQTQLITQATVQGSVEQTYGIKLQTADAGESGSLLNLEDELKKQVISQKRAISVVADALRRSRSGVGNPDRPIGTFLFLGPTGVGKTELSKALARSYFNDESALIRVDMNQYVSADDVLRLISPVQGSELGFLGQVRKQPFSVILLDEIEKAHPSVINTLLQMLDEGLMRDSENKTVSFRDAIIIATSNAGADDIRKFIEEGKQLEELEATFTDTLISRGSFTPEFINRFDEVVLFKPLSQEDLVQVIDLILAGINRTLDARQVNVNLTKEAKSWLVEKGYDPKLGARPMRRMVQRHVENIVAKRLLEHSAEPGSTITLDAADFESAQ